MDVLFGIYIMLGVVWLIVTISMYASAGPSYWNKHRRMWYARLVLMTPVYPLVILAGGAYGLYQLISVAAGRELR